MEKLINIKNSSYSRYEELILRREELKKEGYQLEIEYSRVFGELIIDVFNEQLKCIKTKKSIEFCQSALNHGRIVNQEELQNYVEKETKKLQDNLDHMIDHYENTKAATEITEADKIKMRKIYHDIVKMIHPDINPLVEDSEKLQCLWQRTIIAYNCCDLELLQEIQVLVHKALKEHHLEEIEISDIECKIAKLELEIKDIMEKDPYQYKFLLSDKSAVEDKKNSLRQELKTYQEYGMQLDHFLKEILMNGLVITWKMN